MAIQGLGNYGLNNIQSLGGGRAATTGSSGGSFSLGGVSGNGPSINNDLGEGNLGLGNVNSQDPNVQGALNSVAGESAIQQQFQNQLALINLQDRVQSQSRTTEILTNIMKSRHDTALDAARNLK
jgi:hypothetical protein